MNTSRESKRSFATSIMFHFSSIELFTATPNIAESRCAKNRSSSLRGIFRRRDRQSRVEGEEAILAGSRHRADRQRPGDLPRCAGTARRRLSSHDDHSEDAVRLPELGQWVLCRFGDFVSGIVRVTESSVTGLDTHLN